MSQVPHLNLPSRISLFDETSPRSEDFRESPNINYPISFQTHVSMDTTKQTTANFPHTSNFSKDLKNPLLSTDNGFLQLIKHQSAEIDSLANENQLLKNKLHEFEVELKSLRRMKVMMREQERTISNLQTSLEISNEDNNNLKEQLLKQYDFSKEKEILLKSDSNFIDLSQFYNEYPPRRI